MKKKEIGKKPRPVAPSILSALFGLNKKKEPQKGTSLFGTEPEEEKSAFYGESGDEGDSFNTSFYSSDGKQTEQGKREEKETSKLGFIKSFTWLEYLVVAFEFFLVVYTILVLANIAPIF
jgi:hypothetical protein